MPAVPVVPVDPERIYGPVIASGIEAGHPWSLRGRIGARDVTSWLQTGIGDGGSGGGALPFDDLGWTKLGHFGTVNGSEHHEPGIPDTRTLDGTVSKQVTSIEVRFADGTSMPAQIIDTGDPRASFFVAVWSAPAQWEVMIARDAAGVELETNPPR